MTSTNVPRFIIVNARGTLADDLGDQGRGTDLGWETEERAEEALAGLVDTLGPGFDADDYSVRELRTTDLSGDTREQLLTAVRDCGEECARAAVAACGSYDPAGEMLPADRTALESMIAARFGAEIARTDRDLWRAWREGQEAGVEG